MFYYDNPFDNSLNLNAHPYRTWCNNLQRHYKFRQTDYHSIFSSL